MRFRLIEARYAPDLPVNAWTLELLAGGICPVMKVLERPSVDSLNDREKIWIAEGRRQGWALLNSRNGGGSYRGRRGAPPRDPAEAYWGYVIKDHLHEDKCWDWASTTDAFGYGIFYTTIDGVKRRNAAHRFSWELHYGPIPEGLCVCHRCDNPPCSNPTHLFLGTKADNSRDAVSKGRMKNTRKPQTHCKRNHPLSGDNVVIKNGHRVCQECSRLRDRLYYQAEQERKGLTVAPRNSDRTHCPKGHPYEGDNLYVTKAGTRQCKTCSKERQQRKN